MNKAEAFFLKIARRCYSKLVQSADKKRSLKPNYRGQAASNFIQNMLAGNKPCMICRIGATELKATLNQLDIASNEGLFNKSIKYIRGNIGPFWSDDNIGFLMHNLSGFFPADAAGLEKFANLMLRDLQNIDVLGSWLADEIRLEKFFLNAKIVPLIDLEPYYHADPWSEVLKGKRVLVIHPYEDSIKKQYANHRVLFDEPRILPKFDLITLKAVQSIAGNRTAFSNWFEALAWMCQHVSRLNFDIAIIGAGAYSLPLASYVKNLGKKALHLGGATQILFGIKGKRWDELPFFKQLYNEYWVRPLPTETPENFRIVESGCYW